MSRWYELYEERTASGPGPGHHQHYSVPSASTSSAAAVSMTFPHDINMPGPPVPQPPVPDNIALMQMGPQNSGTVAPVAGGMGTYQPGAMPFVPPHQMQLLQHVYGPYAYVHPMATGNQPGTAQTRPPNFPSFYPMPVQQHNVPGHLVRCPYQGQYTGPPAPSVPVPLPSASQSVGMTPPGYLTGPPAVYHAGMPPVRTPMQFAYLAPMPPGLPVPPSYAGGNAQPVDVGVEPAGMNLAIQQQQPVVNAMDDAPANADNFLLATFRVGMLALETLAKRVHDDRPHIKYARNPPHGEEVKWLLGISCMLGMLIFICFTCNINYVLSCSVLAANGC